MYQRFRVSLDGEFLRGFSPWFLIGFPLILYPVTETKAIVMRSKIYLSISLFKNTHWEKFSNITFLNFYAESFPQNCFSQKVKNGVVHLNERVDCLVKRKTFTDFFQGL